MVPLLLLSCDVHAVQIVPHIMPLVVKVCQIAPFLPLCQTPHTNWLPLRDQNLLECCPESIMMDWSVSVWFWKSYMNVLVNKVHLGPLSTLWLNGRGSMASYCCTGTTSRSILNQPPSCQKMVMLLPIIRSTLPKFQLHNTEDMNFKD